MPQFQFGEEYDPNLIRRLRMIGASPEEQISPQRSSPELDELRSYIQQMPERREPSAGRKVMAAIAGGLVGAGGGPGGEIAHQISQGPYLKEMQDWEHGVGKRQALAGISEKESEQRRREAQSGAAISRYGASQRASEARERLYEKQMNAPGEYKPRTLEELKDIKRLEHPERPKTIPRPALMTGGEGRPGVALTYNEDTGKWEREQVQTPGPVRPYTSPLDVEGARAKNAMERERERTRRALAVADKRLQQQKTPKPLSPAAQMSVERRAWAEALKKYPEFTGGKKDSPYVQTMPGVGPFLTPEGHNLPKSRDFILEVDALRKKYASEAQTLDMGSWEELPEDEDDEEE